MSRTTRSSKNIEGIDACMSLLSGYTLGELTLSNRMVMAPMTRCRAVEGNVPGPLTVLYLPAASVCQGSLSPKDPR